MSLSQNKKNEIWYYDFWINGQRFNGSTGSTSHREAKAIEDIKRAEARALPATQLRAVITVAAVMAKYWSEIGHTKSSAGSIRGYIKSITDLVGPNKPYKDIGPEDVNNYMMKRRALGMQAKGPAVTADGRKSLAKASRKTVCSDSTMNNYILCWRAIHRIASKKWGYEVKQIEWGEYLSRLNNERIRSLDRDELRRLLKGLPHHILQMVQFSLVSGARLNEVESLTWEFVDMHVKQAMVIAKGKGGARRTLLLNDQAMAVLCERRGAERRPEGEPVFDSTNRRKHWETALVQAEIKNFRWHDLRHTFATELGRNGVALEVIKELMGHADIKMTMRYRHILNDEARRALERAPKVIKKLPEPEDA